MIDLHHMLKTLCECRPVFHSEADFQHALAWHIHEQWPKYSLRLEYHLSPGNRDHLDVLIFNEHNQMAIELKYKTRSLFVPISGEVFWLRDHGAQDQGRYDFLDDIQRLERFVSEHDNRTGYAILLTNDGSYWNPPRNASTVDASFRIHEGRVLNGILSWGHTASKGTTKDRVKPITIEGTYKLTWQEYHEVEANTHVEGARRFKYLIVKVGE